MSGLADTVPAYARRIASALPWLAIAALWMIVMPYRGIFHDAVLYSFQALAHLHPESLANDIFLRYGSQDRFSLFSTGYSALVSRLGVETAAAWTTFAAQLALLALSWLLARRLVSAALALMGLAFVIVLPTEYVQFGTFRVLESFVSPRMPAEACAIGAILSMLSGRRWLCALLLAGSALLHPLMAAPAMVVVAFLAMPDEKRWHLPAACAFGVVLLAGAGSLPALDGYRIDAAWDGFFRDYAGYLYAANWRIVDWMRVVPALLTLLIGVRLLETPAARRLGAAALMTALLGIAIMVIGADWLRLPLVLQGQGYRWMWPAVLLGPLLLPAVALQLWRSHGHGRAALLALAALWIARGESFGVAVAAVAALFASIAVRRSPAQAYARWMLATAGIILVGAAFFSLGGALTALPNAYEQTHAPATVDRMRSLFADGIVPTVLLLAVFAIARAPEKRSANAAAAVALLIACVVLVPTSHAIWNRRDFDASLHAAFADWRNVIPAGAEVAWLEAPELTWLVLERPSYFSIQQTATGVFSRTAALELLERERQLIPFMKADGLSRELYFVPEQRRAAQPPARSIAQVCAAIDARFIVVRGTIEGTPLRHAPSVLPAPYRALRLYRCDPTT